MQVFLIRHPRPLIEAGLCYGRLDVDSEDPQPVAARLLSLLPAAAPLISSPLRRARCLAELLHAQPVYDDRLQEIDFGEWEGRRWSDLPRDALDAWAADVLHFVPPGGESAAMLQARAVACVSELGDRHSVLDGGRSGLARDSDRESRASPLLPSVVLLSHSGVMRALLGHWLHLPVAEWSRLKFDFGSVTRVDVEAGHATLRYTNRQGDFCQ